MLGPEEKNYAFEIARRSLAEYVNSGDTSTPNRDEIIERFGEGSELLKERGCFVTLTSKATGELRGCIGSVVGHRALYLDIASNAVNAGVNDPRFPELSVGELGEIDYELSVIGPLTPVSDPSTIIVGKHGLVMKRGGNLGLLLPQVPVEWGWDLENFLAHTCQKAGLTTDAWQDPETEILSFTADVYHL